MAEISGTNGNTHGVVLNIMRENQDNIVACTPSVPIKKQDSLLAAPVPFFQKILAETVGTYFLVFAGCSALASNAKYGNVVTVPGIAVVWGMAVMVLVYSLGHISGAHINPAVTIAFASCKRFPIKQVPFYVLAQVLGSTLAAGTLRLVFHTHHEVCTGGSGSVLQVFVIEFIITFLVMFVISAVATDNRAIGELAGLAIGSTVLLNAMFAIPVSGASMNPARSLATALVSGYYDRLWVFIVSPTLGAIAGAWVYNTVRYTDKPLREIIKSGSFIRNDRTGST